MSEASAHGMAIADAGAAARLSTCRSCARYRTHRLLNVLCSAGGAISVESGSCPENRWPHDASENSQAGALVAGADAPMDPRVVFDRVVCINLDRRMDRWEAFQRRIESVGWPFAPIQRFSGVDGRIAPHPRWWKAGAGAWGCHQSHVRILEESLRDGVRSVLILEDDVLFCPDFAERAQEFLRAIPPDWDGIMLGGQHLIAPVRVSDQVLRVRNGNRTHAHALRGRYTRDVYRHLCDYPAHALNPTHHVDHRLGALHKAARHNVYAPLEWLAGQADGFSDIKCRGLQARFWQRRAAARPPLTRPVIDRPLVVVLGPYRGGTSCVAGILHSLGWHLGIRLLPADGHNPSGYYEPVRLRAWIQRAFDEPRFERVLPQQERIAFLKRWLQRQLSMTSPATPIAVKHPLLCLAGADVVEAWGENVKFISVRRPVEDVLKSLRRTRWWRPAVGVAAVDALLRARGDFLRDRPHLVIDFDQLRSKPDQVVRELVAFWGASIGDEAIRAAAATVLPETNPSMSEPRGAPCSPQCRH